MKSQHVKLLFAQYLLFLLKNIDEFLSNLDYEQTEKLVQICQQIY